MATGLVISSYPVPALSLKAYNRLIWETSPGPVLILRSYPRPALAISTYTAVLYEQILNSYPVPALALSSRWQLSQVNPAFAKPRPLRAWQRDIEKFAITQERERHVQALWQYGELAIFALMWAVQDVTAGLAQRCTRCNQNGVDNETAIARAYGQGPQYNCPVCYGSQLEAAGAVSVYPGLRALLIRPAMITDIDPNQQFTARGVVNTAQLNAESTPDFKVRNGDYLFRQGGGRYRLRVPRRVTLRTGFAQPFLSTAGIDYNQTQAALEDPASASYIIPPDAATVAEWLGTYTRVPVSYEGMEIINGPLIPEEAPPPAASGELEPSVVFPLPVR
jgi:hypothetical protein